MSPLDELASWCEKQTVTEYTSLAWNPYTIDIYHYRNQYRVAIEKHDAYYAQAGADTIQEAAAALLTQLKSMPNPRGG